MVFPAKADELDITVGLVADLEVINPFDFFVEDYAESFPFSYPPSRWPPTCSPTSRRSRTPRWRRCLDRGWTERLADLTSTGAGSRPSTSWSR